MMKENRKKLIISSLLVLIPMFFGFLMWNQLPDTMMTHWGVDGVADGSSTKLFAVTVPFIIMLLIHWFCLYFTAKDPGNDGHNKKMLGMLHWIFPIVSIMMGGLMYSVALGWDVSPATFVIPLLGILFIIMGNYLPKCKQNSTVGIKVSWTLQNEENWNRTHRFGGKAWVAGGFLILFTMFLPNTASIILFSIGIAILILAPIIYSYLYYRKQKKEGSWTKSGIYYDERTMKMNTTISLAIIIPILILVAVLMFTGDIEYEYGEDSFTIEADYWSDATVKYENIDSITYREDFSPGMRTYGFGSFRLGMGTFENDEFGSYTRFCYERCEACVVLEVGDKMLVINGKDEASTREIYDMLQEKMK